jgi:O-antigen/teichoic acid export membrane protein
MSIRRRLVVGVAWMFAGNWTEQAANFLVFIVLARMLGAEAFGLAAMAIVFVLLGEFLVRETLTETIIQLKQVEDGHLDAVFWLLGLLSVCIVGLTIICADWIAGLFSEPRVAGYLVWATPAVLCIGLSGVPVACLRRQLEFRVLAIRATLGVLAGGAVGIAMALGDLGPWSLVG